MDSSDVKPSNQLVDKSFQEDKFELPSRLHCVNWNTIIKTEPNDDFQEVKYEHLDVSDIVKSDSVRYDQTTNRFDTAEQIETQPKTEFEEVIVKSDCFNDSDSVVVDLEVLRTRTDTGKEHPDNCGVYNCFCQSLFSDRRMKTHTERKSFKCILCEFDAITPSRLKQHMMTHTGEKPHKCSICDYAAIHSQHLKRHMRKHTGEKPYKCTTCDYACIDPSSLKRHMLQHTGEKPHKCTMCGYATIRSYDLKTHILKHTGERPYKCTLCHYGANDASTLRTHMRKHTGEKPHKCNICEYAASRLSILKIHMRKHTRVKPN